EVSPDLFWNSSSGGGWNSDLYCYYEDFGWSSIYCGIEVYDDEFMDWDMTDVSKNSVPTGEWVHVALVFDDGTLRLFVDGVAGTTAAPSGAVSSALDNVTTSTLRLGVGYMMGATNDWKIDEFRFTQGE